MDLEQMWQSTLGEMEVQLTKAHFATWLKNSRLINKKDDTLFVALPSNFAKTWVEEKYQKNIIGIVRNMDNVGQKDRICGRKQTDCVQ
jgi:chromosomal replication initiation ATPase DnaA